MSFILNAGTKIHTDILSKPVENAVRILKRDIAKVFGNVNLAQNKIVLIKKSDMDTESFKIDVANEISIYASDDLGFVYALLYISEKFLGIKPFWFWLDQKIQTSDKVEIAYGSYESAKPAVKYRGWFFNDEVLIMKWNINGDPEEPWRMGFEALLRCGGNMTIPGTDKNARKYRQMASDMGLWITHHHAEPLGAEMFVRAYPNEKPNYSENSELFLTLWKNAIEEQKDFNVIWSLGFRGQGDCPFWSNDSSGKYDTPPKQGALISELIEKQRRLIMEKVKNPVFCTNLYGEIMELYNDGHINFADDIIKISADNGYGKMVTRRRDNHCTRISSLPSRVEGKGGIYYHASFYDLQAANHITMLPNSVDFVERELEEVVKKNAVDYWIINCSNVRPHAYYLDAIRKKWYGENISDSAHSKEFANDYYNANKNAAKCLADYPNVMFSYGDNDDEHTGEQFYTENIRMLAHQFICDKNKNAAKLKWLTGDVSLSEQIRAVCAICEKGADKMQSYYDECVKTSNALSDEEKRLFDSTILLQAAIHEHCTKGVILFGKAYSEYEAKEYKKAFITFGMSAESFDAANNAMRASEYDVWQGFYANDCFADVKHTAYMVKKMMGVIRELGDNARHDLWYRDTMYAIEDRYVMSLLVEDNHMTDWDLYLAMKEKQA